MSWQSFVKEILPYLVGLVTACITWLTVFIRTSINSISKRLNSKPGIIERSAVTDPTGYYKASNVVDHRFKAVYDGKELDMTKLRFIKEENIDEKV